MLGRTTRRCRHDDRVRSLVILLASCVVVSSAATTQEEVFASRFDIVAGAREGAVVHGRLNPRANRNPSAVAGWEFKLDNNTSPFELVNGTGVRDGRGRLFGALRVRAGTAVGPAGTAYDLTASLVESAPPGRTIRAVSFQVLSVAERTELDVVGPRVLAMARSYGRMWGGKRLKGADLEARLAFVEDNAGRLPGGGDLYAWSADQKRTEDGLKDLWVGALEELGGLGYAIAGLGGALDNATRARTKAAIYAATAALADAVPVDVADMYSAEAYLNLADSFKAQRGEGFATHPKLSFGDRTHQWDFAEQIGLACAEVAPEAAAEALQGDSAAIGFFDGMTRLVSDVMFALTTKRRKLGDASGRWADLLDFSTSNGVWSDANLGHRGKTFAVLAWALQDYNRPITYVPYWYDDYDFDSLAKKDSLPIPHNFSLVRSLGSVSGAPSDVVAILAGSFVRPFRIKSSGYLPDGFISHHADKGNDAALNAYGFAWLETNVKVASIVRGTVRGDSLPDAWFQTAAQYLTYTYSKVCFRGHLDFAFVGRSYSSDRLHAFWDASIVPVAATLASDFSARLPGPLLGRVTAVRDAAAGPSPNPAGNTAFWVSNAMVHRAAAGWYMSVRMRSRRAHGNENFDKINKCWHCGSGFLQARVHGDEYDQIRARMDWRALPGVTEEWRRDAMPETKGDMEGAGGNTFAAVASDGELGVAAFENSQHEAETMSYAAAASSNGYFFQSFGAVALGAGVRRVGAGEGAGRSIVTTLDQARWRGNITLQVGAAGAREVIAFDVASGCSRTVSIAAGEVAWLHQGSVGYVVKAPAVAGVSLELRCAGDVDASDPEMRDDAEWGEDRRWDAGSEFYGSDVVFIAALHHGPNPANATYQYAVLPGTTAAADAARQAFALFLPDATNVVRNDQGAQAVVVTGGADGPVVQAAMFEAGAMTLPLGGALGTVLLEASGPCVIQARPKAAHWVFSVAQGDADGSVAYLDVSLNVTGVLTPGSYAYELPGIDTGIAAVDDVQVSESGGRTLLRFGLPHDADAAAYGNRAELFYGAPVTLQVPTVATTTTAATTTTTAVTTTTTTTAATTTTTASPPPPPIDEPPLPPVPCSSAAAASSWSPAAPIVGFCLLMRLVAQGA